VYDVKIGGSEFPVSARTADTLKLLLCP